MAEATGLIRRVAERADLDESTAAKVVQVVVEVMLDDASAAGADAVTFAGFGSWPFRHDRRSGAARHNVTVRLSDAELSAIDTIVQLADLPSRSEAIRAAIDLVTARARRAALVAAVAKAYGPVEDQPPAWGLEAWQAVDDAGR